MYLFGHYQSQVVSRWPETEREGDDEMSLERQVGALLNLGLKCNGIRVWRESLKQKGLDQICMGGT